MANYYTPESQPVQTWDYTLNNGTVAALQEQLPPTDMLSAPFLIGNVGAPFVIGLAVGFFAKKVLLLITRIFTNLISIRENSCN